MVSKATSRRAPIAVVTEVNIPTRNKGKRKIVDDEEAEQRCKFKVDPLVQKVALSIEAKRQQRDRRTV